jgi:cystathionine gamma-synthase
VANLSAKASVSGELKTCLSTPTLTRHSFPYTDTLKILQKWGAGTHHFGTGLDEEIPKLQEVLKQEPGILSLFTEFPSNPLLRSANLTRLRELADEHGFLIVIDETIGTFANVEVLPMADIVVSSLTKIFSGDCNVMGGR